MSDDFARTIAVVPKSTREEIRCGFGSYNGRRFADVRVWTDMAAGVRSATKSGLSFSFSTLPAFARAVNELLAEAKAAGLIGGDGE